MDNPFATTSKKLQVVNWPDPILTTPVPEDAFPEPGGRTKKLCRDLVKLLGRENGLGISGPQVGLAQRITVIAYRDEKKGTVRKLGMINPRVVWTSSNKDTMSEGCLSLRIGRELIMGQVTRPCRCEVEYVDAYSGDALILQCDGLLAKIVQHEVDHLNGRLILDHWDEETLAANAEKLDELRRMHQ